MVYYSTSGYVTNLIENNSYSEVDPSKIFRIIFPTKRMMTQECSQIMVNLCCKLAILCISTVVFLTHFRL